MNFNKEITIEHFLHYDNLNSFWGSLYPNQKINSFDFEKNMGIVYDRDMYIFNNYGFRCDDFKNNIEKKHILFAGCSETEGVGNYYEDVWAKQLYEKIKLNEEVDGYFNIGKQALSSSMIIKNIFNYIKMFGKPEVIFAMFPDHKRFVSWSTERDSYTFLFTAFNKDVAKNIFNKSNIYNKSEKEIDIKINEFYTNLSIIILNDFCKINNIKLYWSSWYKDCYKEIANKYEIDGHIDIYNNKYIEDAKISDLKAKDNAHFGVAFHKMWAEIFYENYMYDKKN